MLCTYQCTNGRKRLRRRFRWPAYRAWEPNFYWRLLASHAPHWPGVQGTHAIGWPGLGMTGLGRRAMHRSNSVDTRDLRLVRPQEAFLGTFGHRFSFFSHACSYPLVISPPQIKSAVFRSWTVLLLDPSFSLKCSAAWVPAPFGFPYKAYRRRNRQ